MDHPKSPNSSATCSGAQALADSPAPRLPKLYRTVVRQRPKKLGAQKSPARERGEGAGPKTHVRGFFEKVGGIGLVGC